MDDSLESLAVGLSVRVTETCHLTDRKGDVRVRVGRQTEEHPNSCRVVPVFKERLALCLFAKRLTCCRGGFARGLCLSGALDDFLDESSLQKLNDGSVQFELNCEKTKDASLVFKLEIASEVSQLRKRSFQ